MNEPLNATAPTEAAPRPPDGPTRNSRLATLAALLGLIALGLAWELWLAPTGSGTLALKVLPLALCIPGVLRYRMFTYRVISILVWLYVAEGAARAGSERGLSAILASVEIALGMALFAACVRHIRWRQKAAV